MLNLNDICYDYDEMETIVYKYSFADLFERYNGFNLTDDYFDVEYNNYLFTIRRLNEYEDFCYLSNDFQIFYNNKWLDFERW